MGAKHIERHIPEEEYILIEKKLRKIIATSSFNKGIEKLILKDGTEVEIPEKNNKKYKFHMRLIYEGEMPDYISEIIKEKPIVTKD